MDKEREPDDDALKPFRRDVPGAQGGSRFDSPIEQDPGGRVPVPPIFAREADSFFGPKRDEARAAPSPSAVQDPSGFTQDMLPSPPRDLACIGLSKAFLTDLLLKILHYSGTPNLAQLTRRLGLTQTVVEELLTALMQERAIEVMSQADLYSGTYRYRLSERGLSRVSEALDRSRYAGPAPVTAEEYTAVVHKLQELRQEFGRARVATVLQDLVLAEEPADTIARALSSSKAGIFYGPSGNGKTVILQAYARNLDGFFLVPHAIYAYGQVIRVYDQSVHQQLASDDPSNPCQDESRMDSRWVTIKRPAIIQGAEIGRESLDLAYDPQARFYQAPPHLKAQGGALIIEDFGRQAIPSRDLLTRWLIPLERGWDTLSLATGEKLNLPFRCQLLFATNQPIKKLADDALLRRILYKVEVPGPRPQDFRQILERACQQIRVRVTDGALDYVVNRLFNEPSLRVSGSYARDMLEMIAESASYDGHEPVLDAESFDRVFRMFVAQETEEADEDAEA